MHMKALLPKLITLAGILLIAGITLFQIYVTESIDSPESANVFRLGSLILIVVAVSRESKIGILLSLFGALVAGLCVLQFFRLIWEYADVVWYRGLPAVLSFISLGIGALLGFIGSLLKVRENISKNVTLDIGISIPRIVFLTAGVLLLVGSFLPWVTVTYPPSDNPLLVSYQSNGVYNGYTIPAGVLLILFGVFQKERRRKLFAVLGAIVSIVCGVVLLYMYFVAAFGAHYASWDGGETTFGIGLTRISPLGVFVGLIGSLLSAFLKEPEDAAFEANRPAAPANLFQRWKIPIQPRKLVITSGRFLILSVALPWLASIIDTSLYYLSPVSERSIYGGHRSALPGMESILILASGLLLVFIGTRRKGKPGESFTLLGVLITGLCLPRFFYIFREYLSYFLSFLAYVISEHSLPSGPLETLYLFLGVTGACFGLIGACLGFIGSAAKTQTEPKLTPADPVPG